MSFRYVKAQKSKQMHFMSLKNQETFWFCDLFILKKKYIYSSYRGYKLIKINRHVTGVSFVNKRYTKGIPLQSKRVYERVRDWTSGWSLSAEKYPPSTSFEILITQPHAVGDYIDSFPN